ncbi:MAG: hypothetical protein ACTHKL_05035, partial [Streptosporangiaceae bacterium]
QQAEIDRSLTEAARRYVPDPRKAMERAKVLRKQAVSAIELFAASEEEAACLLEQLADSSAERREELLHAASQARAAAARAQELVRQFVE